MRLGRWHGSVCSAAFGVGPVYRGAGRGSVARSPRGGHGLVCGGASVGLMGAMADAALETRGELVGVIPRSLVDRAV